MPVSDLQKSTMWLDVKKIIADREQYHDFTYKGMLHTEQDDVIVSVILSIDTVRDYVGSLGDRIHIEFKMPAGDYMDGLIPYKNNLEFSIKTYSTSGDNPTAMIDIVKYKAVFIPGVNANYTSDAAESLDKHELNRSKVLTVKLQLLELGVEPVRVKEVWGTYKNLTVQQLLFQTLGYYGQRVLVESKPVVEALDIIEPDNKARLTSIVINHSSLLVNLPMVTQRFFGVYNDGLGSYIQRYKNKLTWFVFPITKTREPVETSKLLMIYAVSKENLNTIENSYLEEGDIVKVVTNGDKKFIDDGEVTYMNHGTGIKQAYAGSMMGKPVHVAGGKAFGSRPNLNYEFSEIARNDELNYTVMSEQRVANNVFSESSKLSERNSIRIDVSWERSDNTLIFPGMRCKYLYLLGDEVIELNGTLVFSHTYISKTDTGLHTTKYNSSTQLTLLVERPPMPEFKPSEVIGTY